MRNASLFIINPTNLGPWGEIFYLYSSQLLISISSSVILQNEIINADASLVFVISGILKSTAARLIL